MLALRQAVMSFVFPALLVGCGGKPADNVSRSSSTSTRGGQAAATADGSSGNAQNGRITFEFTDRAGLSRYTLVPQSSAAFVRTPAGAR